MSNVEQIRFSDVSLNLVVQGNSQSIPAANLNSLIELYVAYFNRVPDADGLNYWITQFKNGMSLNQIGDSFYEAAVSQDYSALTGYSNTMTNSDFVITIFANVLSRAVTASDNGVIYWASNLDHGVGRGSVVNQIIVAAHSYKGDATYGWVADLLDNKLFVGKTIAIDYGLTYNNDGYTKAHEIAAAVTATGTAHAIELIGVTDAPLA